MKKRISNPFITGGYIGPEYFCDRTGETEKLVKAISSKRNITLISLRRMGKTGLLRHVKHILESGSESKSPAVIYVDLLPSMDANDMLNSISTALLNTRNKEKNFTEKVLSLLGSLRPRLSYDNLTGQPVLEVKTETVSDIQYGIEHVMKYISEIKEDLVLMLDEFQQIGRYPEENIEHLLRTVFQSYPAVPCIFSGSSRHMLERMFSDSARPFYQSAELMYLDKIKEQEYRDFIVNTLTKRGIRIDDEVISRLFRWTHLHTWYVQYVCNLAYEIGSDYIDDGLLSSVFERILISFEPLYDSYRSLLPDHQYRLLQAIAAEDGVSQINAGDFISKYNLTGASSVTTSVKSLSEKGMIVKYEDKWILDDVFFSRWLQYHYIKGH
jgi:AAA+ ATPase superfamily predicted ATPase